MSFDRMDNYSGAYPGSLPRRSQALPQQSVGKPPDTGHRLSLFGGRGAAESGAARHGLAHQWLDKTAIWGSEELAAALVNDATATPNKAGQPLTQAQREAARKLGIQPSATAVTPSVSDKAATVPKTYSELFKLGTSQLKPGEMTWSNYSKTVRQNLEQYRHGAPKNLFKDVSLKSYVNGTLVEKNFRPIQDAVTNRASTEWGTVAFRTAAAGLMGFDVFKHTNDAYKLAKAKEDGSLKGTLNTFKESGKAFGKYTFRDGATWEAAAVGAAVGKAVIPVALGSVSLGGVAVGALVGIGAQKMLDKALKTGDKDPVQQQKNREKEAAKRAEQYSPFRVNAIKDSKQ